MPSVSSTTKAWTLYSDRFIFSEDGTLVSIEGTKLRVGEIDLLRTALDTS